MKRTILVVAGLLFVAAPILMFTQGSRLLVPVRIKSESNSLGSKTVILFNVPAVLAIVLPVGVGTCLIGLGFRRPFPDQT